MVRLDDAEQDERADGGADAEVGVGERGGVEEERERRRHTLAAESPGSLFERLRSQRTAAPEARRTQVKPAASMCRAPSAIRVRTEFDAKAESAIAVSHRGRCARGTAHFSSLEGEYGDFR